MPTITLRPEGDYSPNEWSANCSPHYTCVDEVIGNEPDGLRLRSAKNFSYAEDYFTIENLFNIRPNTISDVKAYYYSGQVTFDCSLYQHVFNSRIFFNGAWQSQKPLTPLCTTYGGVLSYSWKNVEWTGLSGSQDDLNNLLLNLISPTGQGLLDYMHIESTYLQLDVLFYEDEKKIGQRINFPINHGVN